MSSRTTFPVHGFLPRAWRVFIGHGEHQIDECGDRASIPRLFLVPVRTARWLAPRLKAAEPLCYDPIPDSKWCV
jgi:hypothetical protein